MEKSLLIQNDEIDLSDIVHIVAIRKKLILSIFILSVFFTAVVNYFLIPRVYEISTTVQLGSFNELLIKKEDAKEIILNSNLLTSIINDFGLKTNLENFEKRITILDINGTDLIKIKLLSSDVDTAFKINDAMINPLVNQGQSLFRERFGIGNDRLKELDSEIKYSEEDIERTQGLMAGLPNSNPAAQADVSLRIILLQNTLPNYESNLTMLRNQRNELRLSLANAKDFKIFDKPIRPKNPIGPKIRRNVLAAGIFSLLIGVFLSFVLELCRKTKKEVA